MKKYEAAKVEVHVFASEDVVTISVLWGYADQNDVGRIDIGRLF